MTSSSVLDSLIIGGGAAGLVAATYLSRFRRSVRIIDGNQSRLLWIPTSHNYPGFAQGIHGRDILARLRAQAKEYGVDTIEARVETLRKEGEGLFAAKIDGQEIQARTVILSTGVVDIAPDFPGAAEAITAGALRFCPICDGYESIGRCTAVVGHGNGGINEALFIRDFAQDLTLLTLGEPFEPDETQQARLNTARIQTVSSPLSSLAHRDDGKIEVHFQDGSSRIFDVVYAALGTRINSELAQGLGANCTEKGEVLVDEHMQTSIDGLYAAGDLVSGLNQITVAMGHAAIAATAIHNRLR